MDKKTVMRDLVQETADNSFELWTRVYGSMMNQIQQDGSLPLGDLDLEV